jgi:hypothetical protein
MERAFRATEAEELAERIIVALEAGQAVGGDKPGKQSAAVIVCGREDYAEVDLRVDKHPLPVAELRWVWGIFKSQTRPFLKGMAKSAVPLAIRAPRRISCRFWTIYLLQRRRRDGGWSKPTDEFSPGALDPQARIAFKARRRARSSVGRARDF